MLINTSCLPRCTTAVHSCCHLRQLADLSAHAIYLMWRLSQMVQLCPKSPRLGLMLCPRRLVYPTVPSCYHAGLLLCGMMALWTSLTVRTQRLPLSPMSHRLLLFRRRSFSCRHFRMRYNFPTGGSNLLSHFRTRSEIPTECCNLLNHFRTRSEVPS